MIENPDKYKFRKLQKIYSPKRDEFKLAEKPYNTSLRPRLSVIAKIISKAKNLKNPPACVFSICEKCKLMVSRLNLEFEVQNTKPTCTTLLYSNVAKVKLMFKRVYLKKIFALITIMAVIITTYLQFTPQTRAATYTLFQTDWSGGVSATESHDPVGGQTEIDTYSAKDGDLLTNGSLTLDTTAGTDEDTLTVLMKSRRYLPC